MERHLTRGMEHGASPPPVLLRALRRLDVALGRISGPDLADERGVRVLGSGIPFHVQRSSYDPRVAKTPPAETRSVPARRAIQYGARGAWMATAISALHPGQNAWRRISWFAGYGGAGLLLQALRFGLSILGARLAGPSEWGFWTLLNTVLAYSYIADFGVVNGMNRDIALFRGRGDRARVASIARTSKSLVLCTSALSALAAA